MQLDHSKDMSMQVSTCTYYKFNALMPVMGKLWCWCVFLHLVAKMSDQFLEQEINIKFCVKLQLYSVLRGEAMRKSSVFE